MKNIFFLVLILVFGCAPHAQEDDSLSVMVTILPLAEFAEKIGGDLVTVSTMIPPGASPHTYEPTPGQLMEISRAQVYIKVGSPIEFELMWLDKIVELNKNMIVIDASTGIELNDEHEDNLHKHHASNDPHIWLSPKNAKIMVENIYRGFIRVDSVHKKSYEENKEKYLQALNNLDHDTETLLLNKENRAFMVYHAAWTYFARDYHLMQIPIQVGAREPTAQDIQHLIEQAKRFHINVIFASPQFNTESAEVIAREIDGRVVLIDPLAKDYISNMRHVAQVLSETME
jgi:zinc transport system substrate-binding protein